MAPVRHRYYFRGRVQGVGFRFTTHRIAREHAVGGSVRNLEDGRVEVVAEGEPGAVAAFIAEVADAFDNQIRDVTRVDEPPSDPPPEDFIIRY